MIFEGSPGASSSLLLSVGAGSLPNWFYEPNRLTPRVFLFIIRFDRVFCCDYGYLVDLRPSIGSGSLL